MSTAAKNSILQWSLSAVLMGVLAFGVTHLLRGEPTDPKNLRASLENRLEKYVELRKNDDWVSIYELVDPRHRLRVPRSDYLGIFGRGLIRVHGLTVEIKSFDVEKRRAVVALKTDAELVVDKLPAKFRMGFKQPKAEDLRRSSESELNWQWRDGEWYYQLDSVTLSGKDSTGREIMPVDAVDAPPQAASRPASAPAVVPR